MSYSISTLLTRNLHDVFGESDPARRRAAINEIFTEDCVFYDPGKGVYRGRDEIDRVAGAIKATHPDFRYQLIAELEELGNAGRVRWVSSRPGEAPAYARTDFLIARDGRIAAVSLFRQAALSWSLPGEGHRVVVMRSALARMSRFSKTGPWRSSVPQTATSTMTRFVRWRWNIDRSSFSAATLPTRVRLTTQPLSASPKRLAQLRWPTSPISAA